MLTSGTLVAGDAALRNVPIHALSRARIGVTYENPLSKSLRDGIFVVTPGFFAKKTLLRIIEKNASNFVPV